MVTPTASLLWAACRPEPDLEGVRTAVRDGADMPGAAQTAVVQRVSPLLWRALMASGAADESDDREWAVMLRRDSARCRAQALLVLPRLAPTALVPLAEASLVPLVFKGAALAGRYPGAGLRPMDDVDLVLPPQQLGRAVETLEAVGWRVVPVPLHVHHEVTLVHDALPGLPLELHRALATWRQRSNHLTTADLWTWRRESTVSGVSVFVLPPAEEIVALAAHAAKPFHVFDRLVWAVDVAVVISDADRSGGGIDWDRVAELARVTRCSTAVAVALGQARRLGAESPEALRRCPVDARGQALAPLRSPDWPVLDRDWSTRTRLRYALVDDWRQRVTLLAGQVMERGAIAAPEKAVDLGMRGLRRWWRLRRETASSAAGGDRASQHDAARSDASGD